MKPLLIILFLVSTACADFALDRALKAAGEKPDCTTDLPEYVLDEIKSRLKDPDSLSRWSWTMPELKRTISKGQDVGWWQIRVTVYAKNSFGGTVSSYFTIGIAQGRVFSCQ